MGQSIYKLIKTLAVALVITVGAAQPFAAAQTTNKSGLNPKIGFHISLAAGSGSNVRTHIKGDTVTLWGYVEDTYALAAIERTARNNGATKVYNYVLRSR